MRQGRVHHAELWGRREAKAAALDRLSWSSVPWQALQPTAPGYLFVPADEALRSEYEQGLALPELFGFHSVGLATARDHLAVQFTADELWDTVGEFAGLEVEAARTRFDLREDRRDWQVAAAQQDVRDSGPDRDRVVPLLYRPFDRRYTYYTGRTRGFCCMPRPELSGHLLAGDNVALVTSKRVEGADWSHVFATRWLAQHHAVSVKEVNYVFPLTVDGQANLSAAALDWVAELCEHDGQHAWSAAQTTWQALKPVARELRGRQTAAEDALWQQVRSRRLEGYRFRRQHVIGAFVVDFCCSERRLVVEVDGGVHDQTIAADRERDELLREQGWQVLRVRNEVVLERMPEALERIRGALARTSPPNPLSARGEGELPSLVACDSPSPRAERGPGGEVRRRASTPAAILAYLYAILHSPSYRARYQPLLRGDFARIPLTRDAGLFVRLVDLGQRLLACHLAEPEAGGGEPLATLSAPFPRYDEAAARVWLTDAVPVDAVPPAVWAYRIGGSPVLRRWLADRRGRVLTTADLAEVRRLVDGLRLTLATAQAIDEAIGAHGGWPLR